MFQMAPNSALIALAAIPLLFAAVLVGAAVLGIWHRSFQNSGADRVRPTGEVIGGPEIKIAS